MIIHIRIPKKLFFAIPNTKVNSIDTIIIEKAIYLFFSLMEEIWVLKPTINPIETKNIKFAIEKRRLNFRIRSKKIENKANMIENNPMKKHTAAAINFSVLLNSHIELVLFSSSFCVRGVSSVGREDRSKRFDIDSLTSNSTFFFTCFGNDL